jgi:hydroxymethylglutaryl-CoA lyase
MELPLDARIVEVGPRDGLQNESKQVPTAVRAQLVDMLAEAGLPVVETGSFVNPKWVPQMADSEAVFAAIRRRKHTRYSALTPNLKGFQRALDAGADEVAVFAAASEAFSKKNINCSIAESLERFEPVVSTAASTGVPVRGYVSCVLGCPYEGDVAPAQVAGVTRALLDMGCYEISLGDTIGVGTAGSTARLLDELLATIPPASLALHFHDTYGQALANILVGLQRGIATIDASVAGLGGCPYARGATGNVATEDVIYMLHGMGIRTGVDADKLRAAGRFISGQLGRPTQSRAARALDAKVT